MGLLSHLAGCDGLVKTYGRSASKTAWPTMCVGPSIATTDIPAKSSEDGVEHSIVSGTVLVLVLGRGIRA